MAIRFDILHHSDTDMGVLLLRRRWSPALNCDVFEMTLDGKLMMTSAVTVSEQALASHALALLPNSLLPNAPLRVLVGGLGFGFTAQAALANTRVGQLTVVERLGPVIAWHQSGLLPWSAALTADPRLSIVEGDFFEQVGRELAPEARYDAILIDIDDSPSLLWRPGHAAFYETRSLETVHRQLRPKGVLGLWSSTHPGEDFLQAANAVFASVSLVEVPFENPCVRQPVTDYLVLATARDAH
ncbi:MAG: spermidine synthase [Patescibacteria group bacterium]|nr:spermidine synthase [Patescibacteria group bacterium]